MKSLLFASVLLSALCSAVATPLVTTTTHEFESRSLADTKLRFVKDSGVCETTPGVGQISGYIDVGTNMSMVRRCHWKVHNLTYNCVK